MFILGVNLGSNASEVYRKICVAFGDGAIKERNSRNCFQRFALSDDTLEDAPKSSRPLSLNDEVLRSGTETNSKLTY